MEVSSLEGLNTSLLQVALSHVSGIKHLWPLTKIELASGKKFKMTTTAYFYISKDTTCLECTIPEFICIFFFISKMRRWKNNPENCCNVMFFFIFSWFMVYLPSDVWYCVSANIPPYSSSCSKKGNYYISSILL